MMLKTLISQQCNNKKLKYLTKKKKFEFKRNDVENIN